MARITELRAAVETAPKVVAAKLQQLTRQTQIKQMGPDGTPWEPTKEAHSVSKAEMKAAKIRKLGAHGEHSFDPLRHIQYEASVDGKDAVLSTGHRAARYTRFGTRWMPARPKVPGRDGNLGWWLPKILAAVRGHLRRKKA